ncbi:MAG: O-antigen ligase family protein [Oscillospiraceae bacterium]|nr:O-antigen ligase family protein [Oscillospiraceae bacterium]
MMTDRVKKQTAAQIVWDVVYFVRPWLGPAFILAVLAAVPVTLPMPLFLLRNGFFVFYASELAVGAGLVAAAVMFIRKKYRLSPFLKYTLAALAVFLVWYCAVTAVRIISGGTWSQSVLTLRTTALPLFVLLMMDMGLEKGRRCMLGLCMYNFFICAVQMGYAVFSEVRMSPFMGNLMVFTCAAVLLIPANFFCLDLALHKRCPGVFAPVALFNLFCVIFLPFMGGSRSAAMAAVMGVATSFFIFLRREAVRKRALAVILIGVSVVFIFWVLNFGGKSEGGLYRVLPTPSQVGKFIGYEGYYKLPGGDKYVRIGQSKQPGKPQSVNTINATIREKKQSDFDRKFLWSESLESIKRSPIIGEGTIYFGIDTSYGVSAQAAHNFILEHINAFGGVGFLLWLAIFAVPLRMILKSGGAKDKTGKWLEKRRIPKLCLMCSVLMMAVQSFFQPTMMIVSTVTLLWLVIASWKSVITEQG